MSIGPDLTAAANCAPACTCAAGVPNVAELHFGVARAVLPGGPLGPNELTTVAASTPRQCACGCRVAQVGEQIEFHDNHCSKGGPGWVLLHHVRDLPAVTGIDAVPEAQQLDLFVDLS